MDNGLIIDFGSALTKSGYYDPDSPVPTHIEPSVVGRPRRRYVNQYPPEVVYIGDESYEHRHHLSMSHPIDHGHIENWLEFEELFAYTVLKNRASLNPKEPLSSTINGAGDTDAFFKDAPLVFTVPPHVSASHLENMAEVAFEMFSFPEILFATGGSLTTFGQGRETGLSIEIGHGITQIVPTIMGYCDKGAAKRTDLGGNEVSMYLQKLLCDQGFALTSRFETEQIEVIKERCVYVSNDPDNEVQEHEADSVGYTYVLPDGQTLRTGQHAIQVSKAAQFLVSEVLFEPSLLHRDDPGIIDSIWNCLRDCSVEDRRRLLSTMTLSGGGSLLRGLKQRITTEMAATCPTSAVGDIKVFECENQKCSAYVGGSLFASPTFRQAHNKIWVTRQQFAEEGRKVLLEKHL